MNLVRYAGLVWIPVDELQPLQAVAGARSQRMPDGRKYLEVGQSCDVLTACHAAGSPHAAGLLDELRTSLRDMQERERPRVPQMSGWSALLQDAWS